MPLLPYYLLTKGDLTVTGADSLMDVQPHLFVTYGIICLSYSSIEL